MNKEIIKKGKMTEEGRLKIRNIRKGKCYISIASFFEVWIGLLSGVSFAEGTYIIYRLLSGQVTEYGRLFDILISAFTYGMSCMCLKEVLSIEQEKIKIRKEIKKEEENILSM